jgi:peptidoglycan/xylan/chitin deacetylase (PgdA/CDA1 family)
VVLLEEWLDSGLELGNHSFSHPDLHRTPLDDYLEDIARGEVVTRPLAEARDVPYRYFRHPMLHTGTDLDTKQAVERFLSERGLDIGPVTIDNSEWIFARAYDAALEDGDTALGNRLGATYVDYIEAMTAYYEGQSRALFEREIPQILLLHANRLNARYLPELIARLRARGYEFVSLTTALEDPAYESDDTYTGAGGITWLHRWAITRDVDRSIFAGEPTTPTWVQDIAGIRE